MPSRRTRAQERIDEIDISPAALVGQIEELRAERDAAAAKADEYLLGLQRERAEFQSRGIVNLPGFIPEGILGPAREVVHGGLEQAQVM